MERVVKYRLVEFYRPYVDPVSGETKTAARAAHHGQKVSSEDETDTTTTIFNVPEAEFDRLDIVHPGWSFTQFELDAMEAGATDDHTVHETFGDENRGDTESSVVGNPDSTDTSKFGNIHAEGHPLTSDQLAQWQVEEFMRANDPSTEYLIDAVEALGGAAGERLAHKILDSEANLAKAAGEEPREDLVHGLGALFGNPAGESEPPEDDGVAETDATDAAKEFALENSVDLADVTGTGVDGRITKEDVQKHLGA